MKVELPKTEIKTICLDTAAKKSHYVLMLAKDCRCFTVVNQMRILQWAQMYETLSEKLKAAGEKHE